MSLPLAMIGEAMLEVIGLNPQLIDEDGAAVWAGLKVFDDDVFWQPTANGEKTITLRLACRPHVTGGLDQYEALKRVRDAREPVDFIRMIGSSAEYQGRVGVRRVTRAERKLAPDGRGWMQEFSCELVVMGRNSEGGGF